MQLVMLSGESVYNRDWIFEVKSRFSELFDRFYIQQYRNWDVGDNKIDLSYELNVLSERAIDLKEEYGIFAKSIGTVLAVKAIESGILKPKWFLFCGLPLGAINKLVPQLPTLISDYGKPVTVIQNEHDSVAGANEVETYLDTKLSGKDFYRFIRAPGETHNYTDYDLLKREVLRLKNYGDNIRD